jgi:hypothetical protein
VDGQLERLNIRHRGKPPSEGIHPLLKLTATFATDRAERPREAGAMPNATDVAILVRPVPVIT